MRNVRGSGAFVCVLVLIACAGTESSAPSKRSGEARIRPEPIAAEAAFPYFMGVRIAPPWEQEGEWLLRAPETIGSDRGLLFIDHFRADMPPVTMPSTPPAWQVRTGGGLFYSTRLELGITLDMELVPEGDEVAISTTLTNNTTAPLHSLGTQFCLIQTGVKGFEDPNAERTFILVGGEWLAMKDTHPGTTDPGHPMFIATNTRDLPPFGPITAARSWGAFEQADVPLIATVSADGGRIIGFAFENGVKIMTNCDIPCIHTDPAYSDLTVGETAGLSGRIYFIEGTLTELLGRFYEDFPEWARANGNHNYEKFRRREPYRPSCDC